MYLTDKEIKLLNQFKECLKNFCEGCEKLIKEHK